MRRLIFGQAGRNKSFGNLGRLIGNVLNGYPAGISALMWEAFADFGGFEASLPKLNEARLGPGVKC
jgi:hypothetical protein